MSPDRVIYSFVLGWVALLAVLIALDWLGNPNRGAFRPKGDQPQRDRETRKRERARRRLEDDASVRAALRDAYGASSLRFSWTREHETLARQLDDALVIDERAGTVDVDSREVTAIDRTVIAGDPLPNLDGELDPDTDTDEQLDPDTEPDEAPDPDTEPDEAPTRGWNVGGDPLSLTARGTEPTSGTIRARVWKNHGVDGAWSKENRALLAAGKAPRRTNPFTGRQERAAVDVDTGRATWGSEPVDPFEATP
jgi:hypothetical protein